MSWLAKSIANSLKLDDDENEPDDESDLNQNPNSSQPASSSSDLRGGGAKGDLSELSKTLTRQFWGIASFLAPPPAPDPVEEGQPSDSEEDVITGIRSDFAEIGGRFKTGISKLSSNIKVSEFTKIASNLLQLGSEEEAEAAGLALGVTPEVLSFVRNVAMHPETWLNFPLSDDDEGSNEFELSDVQVEHALAVERLAPALAALRMELCPEHMTESHFWMIYYVLVHPRLSKNDSELLSTPKVVEVRAMLSHELKKGNMTKPESDPSPSTAAVSKGITDSPNEQQLSVPQSDSVSSQTPTTRSAPVPPTADYKTEIHSVQNSEIQIVDKTIIEENPVEGTKHLLPPSTSNSSSKFFYEKDEDEDEDDADDWLKEETEMDGEGASGTSIPIVNDEDVSFSDLEDDDTDAPSGYKKATSGSSDSSAKDSRDWVQLNRSSPDSDKDNNSVEIRRAGSQVSSRNPETKESNDWLDDDDIDII